ncbi:hypothetical protein I6F34_41550, partial [Bradyrhizobium sp. BRP05]|nr:hypothetical protein [Bradyrhizobium sp. BRP05]
MRPGRSDPAAEVDAEIRRDPIRAGASPGPRLDPAAARQIDDHRTGEPGDGITARLASLLGEQRVDEAGGVEWREVVGPLAEPD